MSNQSGSSDDPDKRHLDDLGRRIEAVREQTTGAGPVKPSPLGVALRLSTELVGAVFVGAAIGVGFDWLTGLRPLGVIVFLILGVAAGFTIVFRSARQMNAEVQEQEKKGP